MRKLKPETRSQRYLEQKGWIVDNCSRQIPGTFIKRDLFGIGDLLALRGEEVLLIQATSASNVSARVNKIAEHVNTAAIRKAGIKIHVHGWYDDVDTPRTVDCS